jgi:hypothetical protein
MSMAEQELVDLIKDLALRFDESRRETREQFERVEGEIRQVHVLVEGLDGKIELVAEGVSNVEEKLDRNIKANEQQFEELRTTIQISHAVLQKRDDDLDARVTVLETSRR